MKENIEIVNRIYDYGETGDVDKAVFACLRLSRNMQDKFNIIMFVRELYPDKRQFAKAFHEEAGRFSDEVKKYLWEETLEHWIDERTMRFSLAEDEPDKTVLGLGVGELLREAEQIRQVIIDLRVPPGMGEYDTAAFTARYDTEKSQLGLKLTAINTILERIKTRCLNYASRIEHQIHTQEKPREFLSDVQNGVNNFFSVRSEDVYNKLQKASELVSSTNPEDFALLLTSVRRSIKAAADYFYPPKDGPVLCSDGTERLMGNNEYLNRLHEFCSITFPSSTSDDLIPLCVYNSETTPPNNLECRAEENMRCLRTQMVM